jgi:hypothetical protein
MGKCNYFNAKEHSAAKPQPRSAAFMPLRHTAIWRPWNLLNPNHIRRRSGVNAALRKIFDKMSDLGGLQCKDARPVKLAAR